MAFIRKTEEDIMAHYLLQAAYTSEAWATMVENPQSRTEAVRPIIEKLGGTLVGSWLSFGDYDTVAILKMPNNTSAAAFAAAVAAGGALKTVKTTPLLETEEGIAAMRSAAECGYRPPTS